jgi:hypothetical protein
VAEPLTDAEIKELREDAHGNIALDEDGPHRAMLRLLDEVERSRALLRRIEWEGTAPDPTIPYEYTDGCPACGMPKRSGTHHGHKPDCELAALIRAGS